MSNKLHAAVTTPNYLASQAAFNALKKGYNAIDAAIVAASVLAVVYPQMNGIGGDNFWLIYDAKTKEVKAINASGRSGKNADISFYKKRGYKQIPSRGYHSANTAPGVVSGWALAHEYAKKEWQSEVSWRDLFNEAVSYAENGFPVTASLAKYFEINTDKNDDVLRNLQKFNGFKKNYLKQNGEMYGLNEKLSLPDLANTLKTIAEDGAQAFYKGEIAKKITKDLSENDGVLTLEDFAAHKADWVKPISVPYRNYIAYNLPPNTQGMASLEILNILNNFDLKAIGETADYYHLLVEATKEAFIDRDQYLTDPDFNDVPLSFLLSVEHAKEQAKRINMTRATYDKKLLEPKGDTIWLGVSDERGNAVSLIQSIYHDFGSGIIPEGTGVLLQNRGSFFSLDKNHVNRLEPNKRTFHTLNAAMMLKNERPVLIYGTMGGEGQPQTQAAIATRIIDLGMSPKKAVSAPRWLLGRTWGASSNDLKMEGRIPEEILSTLKERGHPVVKVEDFTDVMGHAGAIFIDENTQTKTPATDPRSDGLALSY